MQIPASSSNQQILEMVVSERRLVFAYHFPFQLGMRPRSGGATLGSQLSGTWGSAMGHQFCSVAAQSWKPRGIDAATSGYFRK